MKIKTIKNHNSFKVIAPPSKSYMNRALLIASLANGVSTLINPIYCDDTKYMINALQQLGIKIKKNKNVLSVYGNGGILTKPQKKLFLGNAGTAFRFLTSLVTLCKDYVSLDGDDRMRKRPINDLLDALEKLGVETKSNNGYPPIVINGTNFHGGKVTIKSNISSQFISSLMMIAPLSKNPIELSLKGKITSKPYIDITMDIMKKFGASVKNTNYKTIKINNKGYKPIKYQIEADASNSSYFMAAAAITKSRIKIYGLNPKSKQGDIGFLKILKKMGCVISISKNYVEVIGGNLKGITVDMNQMPDLVPTLAVIALFAQGKTIIKNVYNLRFKECDRISALKTELIKIGAKVKEFKTGLIIQPNELKPAYISTYNDHRMAMSFSIAGLKIDGIIIENPSCVKKSFPEYWKVFKQTFYC